MVALISNSKLYESTLSGKPPRCFIKGQSVSSVLSTLGSVIELSEETPTKSNPGLYTFIFVTDGNNRVLSFRHTETEIYGLRTIGVGDWLDDLKKNHQILHSLEIKAQNIFTSNFKSIESPDLKLSGLYINRVVPDDAKKLGVIIECRIKSIDKVVLIGSTFFDYILVTKEDAFAQSTKYDHWSSQVIFSIFHPFRRDSLL